MRHYFSVVTVALVVLVLGLSSCAAPKYHQEIKVYNESGILVDQYDSKDYTRNIGVNGVKKVNISNHCVTDYDDQIQYPTTYTITSFKKKTPNKEKQERLNHWREKGFKSIIAYYCGRTGNLHLDKNCEKLVKEMSSTSADLHICECTSKKEIQHLSQRHWECKECMKNKW